MRKCGTVCQKTATSYPQDFLTEDALPLNKYLALSPVVKGLKHRQ